MKRNQDSCDHGRQVLDELLRRQEKRRRAERRNEFFDFWFGFVLCRAVFAFALPPLLAWLGLTKLGVNDAVRLLVVVGLSILLACLGVWLLVRWLRD
jgi:hypothetical protein